MLHISKLLRISTSKQIKSILTNSLNSRIGYRFTLQNKKTQLILHSEQEVQKMHIKRNNKQNEWSTFKEGKDNKIRVSLIGLPNSGKSTLFNCIVGQRLAIVDPVAGMTRDRRQFDIMEGLVRVIDTPGVQLSALGKKMQGSIKQDIFKQTVTAIHESDIIIIVIDCKKSITNSEIQMVNYLRRFGKKQKIALALNKAQNIFDESLIFEEASRLGIQKKFVCSGENGTGIFQIIDYINSQIPIQAKQRLEKLKMQRTQKFQKLIKKIKQQMKQLETKGININQWEKDFRKINPNPELNSDLDYQQYQNFFIKPEQTFHASRGTQIKNIKMKNTIKICFIGRPNVGKSSLINQILGQQRMVVSETAHTTRDSIATKIIYKNRKIQLVDTAGLDNHNIQKTEEQYLKKVQQSTMLHVKESHVVVYVMDAYSAFKIQDFKLIRQVIQQGRPIVIAVNKWEAIKQEFKYKAKNYLNKQIDQNLGHIVHGHPVVFVSAKMNDGIDRMIDSVISTYDKWNSRISTGMLNDWLDKFKKLDNLPKVDDVTLKINFLLQASVRPPHFIFFVNNKKMFKDNYMRFVTDNMAKQFKMDGIPLRISLRSTNNKQNQVKSKQKQSPKKQSKTKQKMEELKKKYNNFGL